MKISELFKHKGETVEVTGWVDKIQRFRKHIFVTLRDGVGKYSRVQVVMKDDQDLSEEAYVKITGKVTELPEGKYSYQQVEIQASECVILSKSDRDFSSRCPSDAGSEVKLEERHLYLRDEKFAIITKLRALYIRSLREYFEESGCTEIIPPCFVGTQCEGGATLFKLDHVGQPAYLTQSSQFYLEYCVPSVGDCYCIYPSFRAEKSHTRRHLTEFLHAEAEWSGIFTLEQHLDKMRQLMRRPLEILLKYDDKEKLLQQIGRRDEVEKLAKMEIITLTHRDAIEYCREHGIYKDDESKTQFDYEDDIPEAQERKMIDMIGKIVLLVKFPKGFKSFYMKIDPDDKDYVFGCDVEVPTVGEVIGSGIRAVDHKELSDRLKEQGLKEEEYKQYIDLRKYGFGHTSGMGLGVDRMLTWILGLHSIREIVTFPRYPGRLFP